MQRKSTLAEIWTKDSQILPSKQNLPCCFKVKEHIISARHYEGNEFITVAGTDSVLDEQSAKHKPQETDYLSSISNSPCQRLQRKQNIRVFTQFSYLTCANHLPQTSQSECVRLWVSVWVSLCPCAGECRSFLWNSSFSPESNNFLYNLTM